MLLVTLAWLAPFAEHEGNCSSFVLNGVERPQDQSLWANCLEHLILGTALYLWASALISVCLCFHICECGMGNRPLVMGLLRSLR